ILEVATDKVDSDVPAPVSGILKAQLFAENSVAQVGDVIATLEVDEADSNETVDTEVPVATETIEAEEIPGIDQLDVDETPTPASSTDGTGRFYSPLVKNIAAEEGISPEELERIPGTGNEGRITNQDILDYVAAKKTRENP